METRTKKVWSCWVLLLSAVGLGACGGGELGKGARTSGQPAAPQSAPAPAGYA